MKTNKRYLLIIATLTLLIIITGKIFAQSQSREVINKAMKDELDRNMKNLSLENLKAPFFISYNIYDVRSMTIKAVLGSIVTSNDRPSRSHNVRVMVGNYDLTEENYVDNNYSSGPRGIMPLEDNYAGIKRALWVSTDNTYKGAAETYERKVSVIKQQNLTEEELSIGDFSKAAKVIKKLPPVNLDFSKDFWENIAKELSGVFTTYPDIYSSNASVFLIQADGHFVNSEGTATIYPFNLIAVLINASTLAEDGEPLLDQVLYYCLKKDELPSLGTMKAEVKTMADNLTALRKAPIFDDSYSGPVLFEGLAVGELFSQTLFSGPSGLLAIRKPIYGDKNSMSFMMSGASQGESLEKKIDRKIIATELDIYATPKTKTFDNVSLIGSYEVDAEGVIPDDKLVLVEKGILKTLLNGRTPTLKVKESNGHSRLSLQYGSFSTSVGPSVINITTSSGLSNENLKKKLIETAKEEGLEYAIIIRKLQTPNSGAEAKMDDIMSMYMPGKKEKMAKPIYVYKISVEDETEELVRSSELGSISVSSMKKILGASNKQMVYNTLTEKKGGSSFFFFGGLSGSLSGIPSSFIVPEAVLFEELDVEKEKRAITKKLPIVQNPVGR